MATAVKSPPSRSVALVNTASLSVSSLSRIGPDTWSGATQRCGGRLLGPPGALGHPQHVALGVGRHPLHGGEHLLHHPLGLG